NALMIASAKACAIQPGMTTNSQPPQRPVSCHINRRQFLQSASAATALAALPTFGADALDLVNGKPRRVGLIGAGWYGKSDLWRLIQVAPVEVISICDPDKKMLAEAVEIASHRPKSKNQ